MLSLCWKSWNISKLFMFPYLLDDLPSMRMTCSIFLIPFSIFPCQHLSFSTKSMSLCLKLPWSCPSGVSYEFVPMNVGFGVSILRFLFATCVSILVCLTCGIWVWGLACLSWVFFCNMCVDLGVSDLWHMYESVVIHGGYLHRVMIVSLMRHFPHLVHEFASEGSCILAVYSYTTTRLH